MRYHRLVPRAGRHHAPSVTPLGQVGFSRDQISAKSSCIG